MLQVFSLDLKKIYMKRLVFILILSFISLITTSQVKSFDGNRMVGKFISFSNKKVRGELLFFGSDSGGQYVWTYFNVSASDNPFINQRGIIRFNGNQTTIDDLYNSLKDVIYDGSQMKVLFVGDKELKVYPVKHLNRIKAKIVTKDGYFYLTDKQIDKLFNK
jgi:hypothetical protein